MTTKKTLVLGASPNPTRYSYKAIHKLLKYDHPVIPMGIKKAEITNM
jgi:predicted CoA-binding protein